MLSLKNSLAVLRKTNALLDGHFVLSSGLHSPSYVQCAKLLSFPNKSEKFTLFEAMNFAKTYDYIASEYTNYFYNIINTISKNWRNYFKLMNNGECATTATFLQQIISNPDTLIARKHDLTAAKEVSERFKEIAHEYCALKDPNILNNKLLLLDSELKIQGLNPGTTADVVVASIFLNRLGL